MAGISRIEEKIKNNLKLTDQSISVAFQDLNKLVAMAQTMTALSKSIANKIKDTGDETMLFKSYLMELGIEQQIDIGPAAGSQELAKQIESIVTSMMERYNKDQLTLSDVYCIFNRARGIDLVSPDDIISACRHLKDLQLVKHPSGLVVVQKRTFNEEELGNQILSLTKANIPMTPIKLSQIQQLSIHFARHRLLQCESAGLLCRDVSVEVFSIPYSYMTRKRKTFMQRMNLFTKILDSHFVGGSQSHDEMPIFAFGDKKTLEKTWKLMDKIVKACQQPRMNLNNSPPFILDILPETYQHLKLIYNKYDANSSLLTDSVKDSEYSRVFVKNLQNRCKLTLKLFKEAKDNMFDETSTSRNKLTRNTLIFNHMLSELKAIFPNGEFIDDKYLITKKESAGDFWKQSFGTSVIITWKTFLDALQKVHTIEDTHFSNNALRQTIDLTCDQYISIFEFDVFTRLFQPWSTLLRNWQVLAVTHPGYKAFLTYGELKSRLQEHIDKPGSFVFRLSCTRLGQWAIGYVTSDGQILQTIVQNVSLSQALTDGYKSKFYLYPDGKDEDPRINDMSCIASTERNITVTDEQYQIYCGVGNSFQTCKICYENDKDIRVEPCNHLLCTSCLNSWESQGGQGCPYCRTEIKETVQIVMDLPRSTTAANPYQLDQPH